MNESNERNKFNDISVRLGGNMSSGISNISLLLKCSLFETFSHNSCP